MFASLNQGSPIYILDKVDKPTLKMGTVVSISAPHANYNTPLNMQNNSVIDIKCLVDGSTYEYNSIPSNFSIVSYNNGKLTISETKLGLLQEVESIILNSRQILENLDKYKLNVESCESILKELNPLFAKEKERDNRLNVLEEKFTGVESKLDKLLNLVTNR